ncbi:hypothetical protein EWM64_g7230 [Hericium alpestre]|uniref:ABC transporter domain-containing protein n=1 Tax=Hericium alpestre TaxID=135208 RepID=A0A4Y9ZPS7_9AGAM|nr:hypothetical protein EWM64_g7230 [Hericium alpestre]
MFSVLWSLTPTLVSVISFFAFVMEGNTLTLPIAFTSIAVFNMIRRPLSAVPSWIVQVLQASGLLIIQSLFPTAPKGFGIENGTFKWNEVEEEESDDHQDNKAPQPKNNGSGADEDAETRSTTISVSASEADDHHFELRDISVMFPDGKLSVVTGPTASGKTALLMALLGELTTLSGRIIMSKNPLNVDEHGLRHSISYAAQSPWLRHQSIKDNILFGYPYDEKRGRRGMGLSGGQKARVALARAFYAPAKYVLLDDPLSAMDTRKARFLFEKLLLGALLAHRTVMAALIFKTRSANFRKCRILDNIAHDSEIITLKKERTVAAKELDAKQLISEPKVDKPATETKATRKLFKEKHLPILALITVTVQVLIVAEKVWIKVTSTVPRLWLCELVEGIVTVHAFSAEQCFLDGLHGRIDLAIKMWYNFWMTSRWLMLNFDVLGALVILLMTFLALVESVSSGTASLCITSAMAFTSNIYWTCQFWTELELDLKCVFSSAWSPVLLIKGHFITVLSNVLSNTLIFCSDKLIVVEDLVIKYVPELPPVLHSISFSLKGQERVGRAAESPPW